MGIRLKIGLGFALLIVIINSLIVFWGAQTLGITLESIDAEKLDALQSTVLHSWETEHAELASLAIGIADSLRSTGFSPDSSDSILEKAELIKTSLSIDWLEIIENDFQLLYPGMPIASGIRKSLSRRAGSDYIAQPALPMRLSDTIPLSFNGYLIAYEEIPEKKATVIIARSPSKISEVPLLYLWDSGGLLYGDRESFSISKFQAYQSISFIDQRKEKGKNYRIRTTKIGTIGPFLMLGYETEAATLTRTGINNLMMKVALLEVGGLLILGFFLGRKLFAPLERLRSAIESVAKGNIREIQLPPDANSDEGDEIERVSHTFNNMVRELAQAQERLLNVQKELARKEKMAALGRFSAGMAHEINNPLGTILVSAGLINDAVENNRPVELEDVQAIIDEAKRCRHIVVSLLQYAHNRPIQPGNLSLKAFLKEISNGFHEKYAERNIILEIKPMRDFLVKADPIGLAQVFNNLFENAADALKDVSNARITIECDQLPDSYVKICVSDNGKGFQEQPDILFEPLITTRENGTGLGLSICQVIIEGHGGRIWALSEPSGLTRFFFTLKTCPDEGTITS